MPGESGISHLLDRMAYKSTSRRTAEDMTTEISKLGGSFFCSSSRETLMYQASIFNQDLPAALDILSDTVLNPLLSPEELDIQKEAAAYEIQEISGKPDMIIPEILHHVAYANNTLGHPLLCPAESLPRMTAQNLRTFVDTWYTPDRIVVAGAGMTHQQLVDVAQEKFGHLQPRESAQSDAYARAKEPSRYTGGERYISAPELDFTHVYVAFEGLSVHDEDIYALVTLQILLGGGGSFSAGGPGKGMYSRLYSNVLNKYHQVDFCSAFHHCYNDSGLFGIAISIRHDHVSSVPQIIAREFETLMEKTHRHAVTQDELSRARNQLKSSLVMALESRLIEVEDLGRQVQVHGKKVSVEEMCAKIDQVDLPNLRRVAARVLRPTITTSSRGTGLPTVVAQGTIDGLGDVRTFLANRGLGAAAAPGSNAFASSSQPDPQRTGLFRRVLGGSSGSHGALSGGATRGMHTSARLAAPSSSQRPGHSSASDESIPEFFRPKTREERRQGSSSQQQGPPSRHVLFYRDIVPPLLRVLAYGSIVYFGLHLTWVVLDREEQDARHAGEVKSLQAEIRSLKDQAVRKAGSTSEGAKEKAKSWWSTLLGR